MYASNGLTDAEKAANILRPVYALPHLHLKLDCYSQLMPVLDCLKSLVTSLMSISTEAGFSWKEGRKRHTQHILFMVIWHQTYGKGPFR